MSERTLAAAAAAVILSAGGLAVAQQAAPPAHPQPPVAGPYAHNRGVTVGIGLGAGAATCGGCDEQGGLAFDFYIGGFIAPRVALMYDVSSWLDSDSGVTIGLAVNSFAAQFWLGPRIWLKSGLGASQARIASDFGSSSEFGFGLTAGVGFDLMQSGSFAVDLSGRINQLHFDAANFTTALVTVGARWK